MGWHKKCDSAGENSRWGVKNTQLKSPTEEDTMNEVGDQKCSFDEMKEEIFGVNKLELHVIIN